MCHKNYLKKTFRSRDGSIRDYVCHPNGIVITHVVVSYNRSIDRGSPRGRYFNPNCEFVHGEQPIIRKYPSLRDSVWGDKKLLPEDEWYGYPSRLQLEDSDDYSTLCRFCYESREFDSCWQIHTYIWSIKACRRCFDSLLSSLVPPVRQLIISFLDEKTQEQRSN